MDEGFNTYSTARAIAAGLRRRTISRCATSAGSCRWVFSDIALSRETDGNRLAGYRRDAKSDVPSTPSFRYFPSTGGSITYNKTALWLNTLERWLGWPAMQRIMATHFDALEVQASEAGRLLRRRQRGRRPRSRAGSSTRCTGARTSSTTACRTCRARATAIATAPTWSCAATARRSFRSRSASTFKNGERVTEHWDGTRSVEAVHLRAAVAGAVGAGRSEPRAAARRQLHEQLEDARAARRRGGDEVVAEVDGLAAGVPALVGGAGMTSALARRHPPRQQRAGARWSASGR